MLSLPNRVKCQEWLSITWLSDGEFRDLLHAPTGCDIEEAVDRLHRHEMEDNACVQQRNCLLLDLAAHSKELCREDNFLGTTTGSICRDQNCVKLTGPLVDIKTFTAKRGVGGLLGVRAAQQKLLLRED